MTNWKADPKVREAWLDIQAAVVAWNVGTNEAKLMQNLCAAVAASGSPPSPKSCRWTQQDEDMGGQFATECGKLWMFTTDGIKENGAKFCPYCGGSITERASSGSPPSPPKPVAWALQFDDGRIGAVSTGRMPRDPERDATREVPLYLHPVGASAGSTGAPPLDPPPTEGDWDGKEGMHRITAIIDWLTDVRTKFGNTCVYAPKLSWGGLALNNHADAQKSPTRADLVQELNHWKPIKEANAAEWIADDLLLRFKLSGPLAQSGAGSTGGAPLCPKCGFEHGGNAPDPAVHPDAKSIGVKRDHGSSEVRP